MTNFTRRTDNAFLTVIVMLVIISVGMAFIHNVELFVFPLVLLATMMIIYLGIKVNTRDRKK
jgi:hypothetical protein